MARRKKHHKKTHHRRRIGAFGRGAMTEIIMTTAGVAGGIIAGRMINNMLTMSPTLVGGVEAIGGSFAATKVKNHLFKGLTMGIAANGLMYALGSKGLALLPAAIGYGPDPMHRPSRAQLQGFREVPKIGFPRPGAIGAQRDRRRMASQYAGVYG